MDYYLLIRVSSIAYDNKPKRSRIFTKHKASEPRNMPKYQHHLREKLIRVNGFQKKGRYPKVIQNDNHKLES